MIRGATPWPDQAAGPEAGRWLGAEVALDGGGTGRVQGVLWDPVQPRVRSLVTEYADEAGRTRRVAVPLSWVLDAEPGRVVLAVGARQLDQLPAAAPPTVPGAGARAFEARSAAEAPA
jgi:hypothetical protein